MAKVVVEKVTKVYGDVMALEDVSLEVEGAVIGVVGINGAGKSTLFRLITGVTAPDRGRILIGGHDLRQEGYAAKKFIGYLPEDFYAYERLTGAEFLEFIAAVREAPRAAEAVEEGLRYFGLYEARYGLIRSYSFGMVKRLGLIAALLGDPDVLVLDEPLGALDIRNVYRLRKKLEALRLRRKTIFLSSHVFGFVEQLADILCILHEGRILARGSLDDLRKINPSLANATLETIFFQLTGLPAEE